MSNTPTGLLALGVGFMDVTFVLLLLRVVTIRMTKRRVHADDMTLAFAGLFTIAICINMITASAYGVWGRQLPVTLERDRAKVLAGNYVYSPAFQQNIQFQWSQYLLFVFQITFARLSIVLFYRRTLVPEPFGKLHWATLSVCGILGVWFVVYFFLYLFQCGTHFSVFWTGPAPAQIKYCIGNRLDLSASGTGLFLDLVIVFLPLPRILTLGLTPAKKLQVASAFMVGLLSVVGGTVRLAAIISSNLRILNSLTQIADPTLVNSFMAYWQVFEVGFAMMAASLPGLRPFINRVASVVDSSFSSMRRPSLREEKTDRSNTAASFSSTAKIIRTDTGHQVQISQA